MRRHIVDVIVVQAQLLSDLLVRQVQPHEIQTQDPSPKRLMVSGQNRTAQVIEPRAAVLAPVSLPMSLGFIMAMADHGGAGTARAVNAVRPSIVPDQLRALGVIDQGGQMDQLQRSHGSVPAEGQYLPAQQPKASKERHTLLSDRGPMVAPPRLCRQHPETQDEPSRKSKSMPSWGASGSTGSSASMTLAASSTRRPHAVRSMAASSRASAWR
jgi:hypothetical protein